MKVGIIGLGSIARKHIGALREIDPQVEIFALRHSADGSRYEHVSDVYTAEAFLSKNPDFIVISNPTSEHLKTVTWLSQYDIPLFIEKPLFDSSAVCPEVRQKSYVACNLRFLDSIQFLKKHLQGRRINEVNAYCGSYLPQWRPGTDWRACYSANKSMGGGVHLDLIHEIDYVCWLFGIPDNVTKICRNVSSLNIDSADYANYLFEYRDFTASVILNYYRRDYKRTLEIVFEDDTWLVDLQKNRITGPNDEIVFESRQRINDTYTRQMKFFLNHLLSSERFNDIEEAYRILKICTE